MKTIQTNETIFVEQRHNGTLSQTIWNRSNMENLSFDSLEEAKTFLLKEEKRDKEKGHGLMEFRIVRQQITTTTFEEVK